MYLAKHDPDEAQRQLDIMNGGTPVENIIFDKKGIINEIDYSISFYVKKYEEVKNDKNEVDKIKDIVLLYVMLKDKIKTLNIEDFECDYPYKGYEVNVNIGMHYYKDDNQKETGNFKEKFEKAIELNLVEYIGEGPVCNFFDSETICKLEIEL